MTARQRELEAAVNLAQAELDRLRQLQERAIRRYDQAPDGDPRKAAAERQLEQLRRPILLAEREAGVAADAYIAAVDGPDDQAHHNH